MSISFPVARSTILLSDYGTGFREPEMVKRRPVVVMSHRLPHRDHLCTVVPLSTTPPPAPNLLYVHELRLDKPLPEPFEAMVRQLVRWRLYDHFGFYTPAFGSGVVFSIANPALVSWGPGAAQIGARVRDGRGVASWLKTFWTTRRLGEPALRSFSSWSIAMLEDSPIWPQS